MSHWYSITESGGLIHVFISWKLLGLLGFVAIGLAVVRAIIYALLDSWL